MNVECECETECRGKGQETVSESKYESNERYLVDRRPATISDKNRLQKETDAKNEIKVIEQIQAKIAT